MSRYAFAVLFSFLHILFSTSSAWAKDGAKSSTAPQRKQAFKKHGTVKSKVYASRRTKNLHSSSKHYPKVPARLTAKRGANAMAARSYLPKTTFTRRARSLPLTEDLDKRNKIDDLLDLRSNIALVWDVSTSKILFEKNSDAVRPIASISKLMTALIVVEARQDMGEVIEVTADDIDRIKHTSSRLSMGSRLTRADMLHIALMSSENRAASALGRNYPGGLKAFVAAMNAKAKELGMTDTHYVEPTGLSSQNVSSARDLAKLVIEAQRHSIIRQYSTNREYEVEPGGAPLHYRNSNRLIANPQWEIIVQKTGYIAEAGRCLVMQAMIQGRSIGMVLLDSQGKFSRATDAGRVREWLKTAKVPQM